MDSDWNLEVVQQWYLSMWKIDHWEPLVVFSRLKSHVRALVSSLIFRFELIWKLYHQAKHCQMLLRCQRKQSWPHDLRQKIYKSLMNTSWFMQESPDLKPDWFDEISLFSIKDLNISINLNRSRFFPQIRNNDTRRLFFNVCLSPFLCIGTILPFYYSEEKIPVSTHCLKIIANGL